MEENETKVKKIEDDYKFGYITNEERYNKIINIWTHTNEESPR